MWESFLRRLLTRVFWISYLKERLKNVGIFDSSEKFHRRGNMKNEINTTKVLVGTIFFSSLFLLIAFAAFGQEVFPTRPINSVIPYPAGGSTDLACRALAEVSHKYFGQPLVTMNKVGAMGVVAAIFIAQQKPDGYTIGHLATSPFYTVPYMEVEVAFDPSSVKPVIGWTEYIHFFIVKGDAPYKTLQEFVAYARSHPELKYAHTGQGNPTYTSIELFKRATNLKMSGVPFRGDADQIPALLGGHVAIGVVTQSVRPYLDSGKLRALGSINRERAKGFDVPTLGELGYELDFYRSTVGAFVHKDTPEPIVKILHDNIKKSLEDTEFINAMSRVNMPIEYFGTKEYEEMLNRGKKRSREILKQLDLLKKEK
jgi:tripartite-type tricarboxylate transporter receptor subunit TctC